MYYCDCCGEAFSDPINRVFDDHPEIGGYSEYHSACPHCGSFEFDEAFCCARCEGYFPEHEVCYEDIGKVCEACSVEIQKEEESSDDEEEHQPFDIFKKLDEFFTGPATRGVVHG